MLLEAQEWATYWAPVHQFANRELDGAIMALHVAWLKYIRSLFDRSLQREYCFRYFCLLDRVLLMRGEERHSPLWKHVLRAVVGFECFGLRAPTLDTQVLVAATTTLRKPCYLLAKLKSPDALDDTQFLPLIAVGHDAEPGLFYHYRQYRLSKDSPMSLLLYLTTSPAHRSMSFNLVDSFVGGMGVAGDPRVGQRGQSLSNHVLRPIIQAEHSNVSGPLVLEFVDVGAGTGAVTATLCEKILSWGTSAGFSPRFRLWFLDLSSSDPLQSFRDVSLRSHLDSALFLSSDYRSWLSQPRPLPRPSGLRVGLALKVFDVASQFSTCHFRTNVLPSRVVDSSQSEDRSFLPTECLATGGAGPEALVVSPSRIAVEQGHIMALASLTEFYRALQLASSSASENWEQDEGVWLPLRAFDSDSLVTSNGASVLSRLLDHCDYLIVEDADLRPRDLVEHLRTFSPQNAAAEDITSVMHLTGNYAYILWSRGQRAPELGGERLW